MVDFHKIDAFFNGETAFEDKIPLKLSLRVKVLRWAKLLMPSLAAILIALLLLFPILKDNNVIESIDVTLPKKGELEKLHMEKTEFSITNKDNKISVFFADLVDETEPGSKLLKIINPEGSIPADENQFIHIDSDIGYYNQETQIIELQDNVVAMYDEGTTAETEYARYDFTSNYGSGNQAVHAYGNWGKLWAEGFEYYQDKELLVLIGKAKVINENNTLWADKEIRYYRLENRIEAEKNVKAVDPENTIYADLMKTFLTSDSKMDVEKIEAYGHVRVFNGNNVMHADKMTGFMRSGSPNMLEKIEAYGHVLIEDKQNMNKNTIYADKMYAFFSVGKEQKLEKIEAFDNVKVVTSDGTAEGDYGLYIPDKSEVEIHHNVIITQDDNVIHGDKAVTNLRTSVSRVLADKENKKRVSGVITGSTVKGKKDDEK